MASISSYNAAFNAAAAPIQTADATMNTATMQRGSSSTSSDYSFLKEPRIFELHFFYGGSHYRSLLSFNETLLKIPATNSCSETSQPAATPTVQCCSGPAGLELEELRNSKISVCPIAIAPLTTNSSAANSISALPCSLVPILPQSSNH